MKKTAIPSKLSLKKETVAHLNNVQMSEVKGGSISEVITRKCVAATFTKTIPPSCTISEACTIITIKDVTIIHP